MSLRKQIRESGDAKLNEEVDSGKTSLIAAKKKLAAKKSPTAQATPPETAAPPEERPSVKEAEGAFDRLIEGLRAVNELQGVVDAFIRQFRASDAETQAGLRNRIPAAIETCTNTKACVQAVKMRLEKVLENKENQK